MQIAVPNLEQSLAFYRNVLALRCLQAPDPATPPATAFVQISRALFWKGAAAQIAPGITHVVLQTDDLGATIAQIRRPVSP